MSMGSFFYAGRCSYGIAVILAMVVVVGYPGSADGQWVVDQLVTQPDPETEGVVNVAALGGNTLVVGSGGNLSLSTLPNSRAGAVYVFENDPLVPGSWTSTVKLNPLYDMGNMAGTFTLPPEDYSYPSSLATDGQMILVGAGSDYVDGVKMGSAYLYQRDAAAPDGWRGVKRLTPTGLERGSSFGFDVDVDGSVAVIGAYNHRYIDSSPSGPPSGFLRGVTYIYEQDAGGVGNWGEAVRLQSPDTNYEYAGWNFGYSVAVDDTTLLVSAPRNLNGKGAVYVYEKDLSGSWDYVDKWQADSQFLSPPPKQNNFGWDVAIDGDTAIVSGLYSNAIAHVYERDDSGEWSNSAIFVDPDRTRPLAKNWLENVQVDISGDMAVVGIGTDPECYDHDANCDFWIGLGDLDIVGQNFGHSDATRSQGDLNGDGVVSLLDLDLLGQHWGESYQVNSEGAVYLYQRDGNGDWALLEKIVNSNDLPYANFGSVVAIENDTMIARAQYDYREWGVYVYNKPAQLVPEPAGISIMMLAVMVMSRRRRG